MADAARALSSCAHCGLPSPGGATYCCAGCEVVAGAIAQNGLEKFYALRETAAPAKTTANSYAELDDAGGTSAALYLEDLRCTACVWLVERTPVCVPGVIEARVDLGRSRVDVQWDPARTSLSAIARHLDRLGHAVHPYRGIDRDAQRRREDRALLVRLGVAGAALGNLMLLAVALYAGLFDGMARGDTTLFRWLSMIVAVPALAYAATPMFRTAVGSLRAGRLHLDLPLSIGILAGLAWGAVNVVRGAGEIYFDSLSMLVFLLLVARFIVVRHQRRASSAAEMLLALTPSRARKLVGDAAVEVSIASVVPDDLLEVLAGDTVPVDGEIVRGRSTIDGGLLTGESRPIEVGKGDRVHAGTVNLTAPVVVRATAVGEETRVGALVSKIEALATRRAPIERFVDRVAGTFVKVVTLVALLTIPLGVERSLALLVVTCPCALALATPLAVAIALGRAARRGILIKGADALERMATPGTLFVDKTGTLTAGSLAVVSWMGPPHAARVAATLEAASRHPVARALAKHAAPIGFAVDPHEELGRGITGGVVMRNAASGGSPAAGCTGDPPPDRGWQVAIGTPAWVFERAAHAADIDAAVAACASRAETPVVVAVGGLCVAVAGLADPLRPDAAASLKTLASLGWRVRILSGDDARVVAAIGAQLGLPAEACTGGVTPEGKLAAVNAVREAGPVVMLGDGVNDAAAIAAATCGIAVSGAAEIAIEAADVYLKDPAIGGVVAVATGARETLRTIRRSLRFSLAYNVVAGLLAVTGVIHPLLAAVAMPASSLTVLISSLRSRAFRGGTR